METETVNPSSGPPSTIAVPPSAPSSGSPGTKSTPASCSSCAGGMAAGPPSYVYALGRIQVRFPNLAVEKEFVQSAGRTDTAGKTDQQTFHAVLSKREHRYLARQLCWVLTVQGLDTYILAPRDPADLDVLIEAIRPEHNPLDIDAVVGLKGPIAPPTLCNGLMVPIVAFDQIYSFDRTALIKAIPKPEKMAADKFRPAARNSSTGSCK